MKKLLWAKQYYCDFFFFFYFKSYSSSADARWCGTEGHGLVVELAVFGLWLDSMIVRVFSNLMILRKPRVPGRSMAGSSRGCRSLSEAEQGVLFSTRWETPARALRGLGVSEDKAPRASPWFFGLQSAADAASWGIPCAACCIANWVHFCLGKK